MLDTAFKFYCVDWALFAFVTIHIWMLGNRWRSAFIFGIMANFCGFAFGFLTGSIATIIMNVVFFLLNLRAHMKWREYPWHPTQTSGRDGESSTG